MPLFNVTIRRTIQVDAESAAEAEERVIIVEGLSGDATVEAEGPIDPTGGDGIED